MLTYCVGSLICDVSWSHHSSTMFGLLTNEGAVILYDLFINKYAPVCRQRVVSSSECVPNHLIFNRKEPLLVVGDSKVRNINILIF